MVYLFFAGLVLSVLLLVASLFTPRTAVFCKVPSKGKGLAIWFVVGVLCFAGVGATGSASKHKPEPNTLPGTPLAYKEVSRDKTVRAAIKRDRLQIFIVPTGEQNAATQGDLAATAMQAAMRAQEETGLAVVSVSLLCQQASNAWGEPALADVSYIPDGKGVSGKDAKPIWETLLAAKRGFTPQELEYLRHWADLRAQYQGPNGTNEPALMKAIEQRMGIAHGALQPHSNFIQELELPK